MEFDEFATENVAKKSTCCAAVLSKPVPTAGAVSGNSTTPTPVVVPTAGAFNDARRREELRLEIEDSIRRFEPRFLSVKVHLIDAKERLETTLRLRIEAVLHAEPAPEAVTFDTLVDPTTDDITVRPGNVV